MLAINGTAHTQAGSCQPGPDHGLLTPKQTLPEPPTNPLGFKGFRADGFFPSGVLGTAFFELGLLERAAYLDEAASARVWYRVQLAIHHVQLSIIHECIAFTAPPPRTYLPLPFCCQLSTYDNEVFFAASQSAAALYSCSLPAAGRV